MGKKMPYFQMASIKYKKKIIIGKILWKHIQITEKTLWDQLNLETERAKIFSLNLYATKN